MKTKETVEWMVDQCFKLCPDAIVNVFRGKEIKAILDKDSWENDKNLLARRTEFRSYEAPAVFEMGDLPVVGRVFNINMDGCKKCQ